MPKKKQKKQPKHNPKLSAPKKDPKDNKYYEEDPYEYSKNYTPLYMVIVFVAVLTVIVVLFVFVFNVTGDRVQEYDEVKLDYEIYTYEQFEDHEDPEIEKSGKWVNCCSRYDDDCDKGLIKGFFNELLGKRVGDVGDDIFIEACQDDDEDGDDDHEDREALSYGFEDDDLYDTDIVLWFKVLAINKTSGSSGNSSFSLADFNITVNQFELFNYILLRINGRLLPF